MATKNKSAVAVADEVWVATALLHRQFPKRPDFTVAEIVARAAEEALHEKLRPSVHVHVVQHCVANRRPNPNRYRMLYETRRGHRRLFLPGDDWHPDRKDAKTHPEPEALPEEYRDLIVWYQRFGKSRGGSTDDPILALRGLGREIWQGVDPDEYVSDLRKGWE